MVAFIKGLKICLAVGDLLDHFLSMHYPVERGALENILLRLGRLKVPHHQASRCTRLHRRDHIVEEEHLELCLELSCIVGGIHRIALGKEEEIHLQLVFVAVGLVGPEEDVGSIASRVSSGLSGSICWLSLGMRGYVCITLRRSS